MYWKRCNQTNALDKASGSKQESKESKEFLEQLAQDSLELYNRTLLQRTWAENAKDQTHKADSKIGKLITANF